jgi:Holliday junction resolvase RusA-like endonuclease
MSDPIVTIVLPGNPIPKGRPRFRIVRPKNGAEFVSIYTDAATVAFERSLAWAGKAAMRGRPPLDIALTVLVEVFLPIPEIWSNKKRLAAAAGDIHPIGRPDADNFVKSALDALNKIVFTDDSIIVRLQVDKKYSESPRIRITVWAFDDFQPKEPELI